MLIFYSFLSIPQTNASLTSNWILPKKTFDGITSDSSSSHHWECSLVFYLYQNKEVLNFHITKFWLIFVHFPSFLLVYCCGNWNQKMDKLKYCKHASQFMYLCFIQMFFWCLGRSQIKLVLLNVEWLREQSECLYSPVSHIPNYCFNWSKTSVHPMARKQQYLGYE